MRTCGPTSHAPEARADEEGARSLGAAGAPFFVLGGRSAVSGAGATPGRPWRRASSGARAGASFPRTRSAAAILGRSCSSPGVPGQGRGCRDMDRGRTGLPSWLIEAAIAPGEGGLSLAAEDEGLLARPVRAAIEAAWGRAATAEPRGC
ncbi:hypothetical protein [Sorangium sp. So ce590]|uniref:hypothetical protein n=1 Tax=unclassified Sorangium TaxID=2621164 RepID=UPI003F632022